MENLIKLQNELKAPKNQYNSFGKYHYRSCEDILEALKPLLAKHNCVLSISDEIKEVVGMVYVEATVTITSGTESVSVKAQAGVNPSRKGMDIAQSFGASSSYARKYALSGLLLIDDNKDADTKKPPVDGENKFNLPKPIAEDVVNLIRGDLSKVKTTDELSELKKTYSTEINNFSSVKTMFLNRYNQIK